jgi:hypothetical protein
VCSKDLLSAAERFQDCALYQGFTVTLLALPSHVADDSSEQICFTFVMSKGSEGPVNPPSLDCAADQNFSPASNVFLRHAFDENLAVYNDLGMGTPQAPSNFTSGRPDSLYLADYSTLFEWFRMQRSATSTNCIAVQRFLKKSLPDRLAPKSI